MKILCLIFGLISLTACSQGTNTMNEIKAEHIDSLSVSFNPSNQTDTNKYFSISDTNLAQYQLPESFDKPKKWKDKSSEREWYPAEFSDTLKLNDVLKLIDSSEQFWDVCVAKSWCLKNYQIAFPYLVARLSVKDKIGLKNTADLIIGCRMNTGDLEFYGHGGVIGEDLFTAAGRASWILNEMTGEEFVSVQCNMSKQESEEYKILWRKYINELKN